MKKNNYSEYLVDEDNFRRIYAFYGGEVFNRQEGDKYRIKVTPGRAKKIEKLFRITLIKIDDEKTRK